MTVTVTSTRPTPIESRLIVNTIPPSSKGWTSRNPDGGQRDDRHVERIEEPPSLEEHVARHAVGEREHEPSAGHRTRRHSECMGVGHARLRSPRCGLAGPARRWDNPNVEPRIAVVGIGHAGFAPVTAGLSYKELMFEAAQRAYHDAGVDPRTEIDSFVCCSEDFLEGTSIFDEYVPDQLGAMQRPVQTVTADGPFGLATGRC